MLTHRLLINTLTFDVCFISVLFFLIIINYVGAFAVVKTDSIVITIKRNAILQTCLCTLDCCFCFLVLFGSLRPISIVIVDKSD